MIAILGGLGAAACWAAATLCSSLASRRLGAGSTLAWVMLVGLAVTAPLVAVEGAPAELDAGNGAWLFLVGAGNVLGLGLVYTAFRHGKVGLVAPIASTEGAVAAVLAVVAGERLSPGAGATLGVIVLGVVLAGLAPGTSPEDGTGTGKAVVLAVAAALSFGIGLYAAGRLSQDLPIAWILLPARALGAIVAVLALAGGWRPLLTRASFPLVLAAGLCEIAGFTLFTVGARHGIAVSVVLASQFAAIAAVVAFLLFRERLSRLQVAGVIAIAAGVAVLSGLQA